MRCDVQWRDLKDFKKVFKGQQERKREEFLEVSSKKATSLHKKHSKLWKKFRTLGNIQSFEEHIQTLHNNNLNSRVAKSLEKKVCLTFSEA